MFQRYANPLIFVDRMLQTGRFFEFIREFIAFYNEEQESKYKDREEDMLWGFYIHRIFDQPFNEFIKSIETSKQEPVPTKEDLKETIAGSIGILTDFNPYEGSDSHGTIQTSRNDSG